MDLCKKLTIFLGLFMVFHSRMSRAFAQEYECTNQDNNGEVTLYNSNGKVPTSEGVVLMCHQLQNGKYTKVGFIYDENSTFNEGAAAAACRQRGFITEMNYGPSSKYRYGYPQVDYCITEIQCPHVKDYSTQGETALLRCSHSEILISCQGSELAAVQCNATSIHSSDVAYNGQLYRDTIEVVNDNAYNVFIHLDGESLPLCMDGYTDNTLDSMCQQFGFTKAYKPEQITIPMTSWYVGKPTCEMGPYSCFTDCLNKSSYEKVDTCDSPRTGLSLYCMYNETDSAVYGSGSKGLCEIDTTCLLYPSKTYWKGVTIASVSVAIFALILLGIALAYITRQHRKWRGYEGINGDGQGGQECLQWQK